MKGHWSRMLEIKKYTFPHSPSDVRFVLTQTQLSFHVLTQTQLSFHVLTQSQLSFHVSVQTQLSFHVFRYTVQLKNFMPLQLK